MHPDADDPGGTPAGDALVPSDANVPARPAGLLSALAARRDEGAPPAAVLAIRLDRFASACETLGPRRAAHLQALVQARIAALLPQGTVMHWVAASDLGAVTTLPAGCTDAGPIAARIAADLSRPFVLDGFELFISSSIGVATDHPDIPAERSMQQAFDAMLRIVRQGGDGLARADKPAAPPTAPLLAALPEALERGELSLQLQPRANFAGAHVSGYTVRLRWHSPALGRVAPQDFLPAVETLGLVGRIGAWLLDSVLPLMRGAEALAPLQFTLLASSAQLHRPEIVDALAQAIDTGGIAAERLCIELPAGAAPPDAGILERFADLRRLGVQLALGDFDDSPGSRLALKALRPDRVSLDVRRLGHGGARGGSPGLAERLHSACVMARRAGAAVCAKGVESRQQLEAVRAWGCHSVQGYLLAQPFPAAWLMQTHAAIQQRARELLAPAS
ncbi:GGDEF domain-containing protein [Cupriavidus consociatus]|uniref:GGDEF domain-containing protein n=1 Tax=Cupriavidus consociatus TaxID=2821357 RepID=UPI001AE11EF4|nr:MULTISPECIES: GGDEF domain-containing protein [unclassified Cupriavidus]MBP0623320.1 GGDEF domain-containing protein [Cupriavidus sp. LEh25]MDK2660016.1 GGDEF domain-containing protein [Cupriavidus sp. LEh21]